jgi:hypothetical protein
MIEMQAGYHTPGHAVLRQQLQKYFIKQNMTTSAPL